MLLYVSGLAWAQSPATPGDPGAPAAPPGAVPGVPGPIPVPGTPGTGPWPLPATPEGTPVPPPTIPSRAPVAPPISPDAPSPTALFELRPSLRLSLSYSDNFRLADRDREENWRTVVGPGLSLRITTPTITGGLSYSLGATHDTLSSSGDDVKFFHAASGFLTWEATQRLTVTVTDSFTYSDVPEQADRLFLRQEREPFTSNIVSVLAQYRPEWLTTSVHYSHTTFIGGGTSGGTTTSHTAGVTFGKTVFENISTSLGYDYVTSDTSGRTSFSTTGHRLTASAARPFGAFSSGGLTASYAIRTTGRADRRDDGYDLWTVSVFNAYNGPALSLSGSIGYSQIQRDSGDSPGSIFSNSQIAYRFARAVLSLTVDSGFSETFVEGEDFGLVETRGARLMFAYPVTPFITTTASATYRQNETTGVGGGQLNRSEETWSAEAGVAIQLLRWLSATLDYRYRQTSPSGSSRANPGFTENSAVLSLFATF